MPKKTTRQLLHPWVHFICFKQGWEINKVLVIPTSQVLSLPNFVWVPLLFQSSCEAMECCESHRPVTFGTQHQVKVNIFFLVSLQRTFQPQHCVYIPLLCPCSKCHLTHLTHPTPTTSWCYAINAEPFNYFLLHYSSLFFCLCIEKFNYNNYNVLVDIIAALQYLSYHMQLWAQAISDWVSL